MTASLRRGAIVEICVELYQRHRDNGMGDCTTCAVPLHTCSTRRNCEKVMVAAGLDPAKFG